jgi:hypothetical protein
MDVKYMRLKFLFRPSTAHSVFPSIHSSFASHLILFFKKINPTALKRYTRSERASERRKSDEKLLLLSFLVRESEKIKVCGTRGNKEEARGKRKCGGKFSFVL